MVTAVGLPLLMVNGKFQNLQSMTSKELETFIPFLTKCSVNRAGALLKNGVPEWWTSIIEYQFPLKKPNGLSESGYRHHLSAIVCRCYWYHNAQYLLPFCAEIASNPNTVFLRSNEDNTTSIFYAKNSTHIMKFNNENKNYDMKPRMEKNQRRTVLTAIPKNNPVITDVYLCENCDDEFTCLSDMLKHEKECFRIVINSDGELEVDPNVLGGCDSELEDSGGGTEDSDGGPEYNEEGILEISLNGLMDVDDDDNDDSFEEMDYDRLEVCDDDDEESNDKLKVSDDNHKESNDELEVSDTGLEVIGGKLEDSNSKHYDSDTGLEIIEDKLEDSNSKNDDSDTGLEIIEDKLEDSKSKHDDSDTGFEVIEDKLKNSDTKVEDSCDNILENIDVDEDSTTDPSSEEIEVLEHIKPSIESIVAKETFLNSLDLQRKNNYNTKERLRLKRSEADSKIRVSSDWCFQKNRHVEFSSLVGRKIIESTVKRDSASKFQKAYLLNESYCCTSSRPTRESKEPIDYKVTWKKTRKRAWDHQYCFNKYQRINRYRTLKTGFI